MKLGRDELVQILTYRFALDNFTKYNVLSVQMRSRSDRYEKLRTISIRTCVCLETYVWVIVRVDNRAYHRKQERFLVFSRKGFILELFTINGLSTRTCSNQTQQFRRLSTTIPLPAVKSPPWHINLRTSVKYYAKLGLTP